MTTISVRNTPPLESGDRLTRDEFEHRYQAAPDIKKAELVEGVVFVASPVHANRHANPHAIMMAWLGTYWMATPGVGFYDNATVRLDEENEPQPDALLRLEPAMGGKSWISDDDYIEGSPELIVEIAASSASYDLNDKLNAYERNGVKEYLVWQIYENKLDWFILEEGRYVALVPDEQGILRSQVFPGLWLCVEALLQKNGATLNTLLQQGLQTAEHQEFVQCLAQVSGE